MKKTVILLGGVLVVLAIVLLWLSLSVGPETAPKDVRSIEVEINGR